MSSALRVRDGLGFGDAFTVITVARLEPLKGVDTLIRAAARSRAKPTLVVVGDATGFSGGPAYAEGLTDPGRRASTSTPGSSATAHDVHELLWAADVFGLASRWEAAAWFWPRRRRRACRWSRATSVAARRSSDGSTGVVLDPEDVAGFAAAIDQMADDPDLRSRLAVGRCHVRRRRVRRRPPR